MKLTKRSGKLLDEAIDKSLDLIKEETDYQIYFKKMLKKFGVKSPMELKGEERKKFFTAVKAGWSKNKK